ncbi:MAG: TIGR02444 family protein [Sneathiella sp.]|nr:MAG: TIGR02444 family protein [Sneathiella sp.]
MTAFSSAAFPPSQLWDYAAKIYSHDAVAEACLRLQDRRGLDVNMILFCVWTAASGRGQLTPEEMRKGIEAGLAWQSEVVEPLRHVRRYLKGPIGPVDSRLGAELARVTAESELYAEHMEIQVLNEIVDRPATGSFQIQERGREAALNLQFYMGHFIEELDDTDRRDALVIWQEAFPDAEARMIELFQPLSVA